MEGLTGNRNEQEKASFLPITNGGSPMNSNILMHIFDKIGHGLNYFTLGWFLVRGGNNNSNQYDLEKAVRLNNHRATRFEYSSLQIIFSNSHFKHFIHYNVLSRSSLKYLSKIQVFFCVFFSYHRIQFFVASRNIRCTH